MNFDQISHFDILIFLAQILSIVYTFQFYSFFHIKLGHYKVALRFIDDDSSSFTGKEHIVLWVSMKLCEFHTLSFQ